MKLKLIKIFTCLLIMCMCLLAFQIKPKAQSSNTIFEPFEVGMTFPVGYEITSCNSDGVIPSKTYYFISNGIDAADGYTFMLSIYFNDNNQYVYSVSDGVEVIIPTSAVELFEFSNYGLPINSIWELSSIDTQSGTGELGIYTEPNAIYNGTYELLANLIYGTTENLTSSQNGTLEFISMLLTIMCILLPFIILFFVIRKLVD